MRPTGQRSILLVEDDAGVRVSLRLFLTDEGYDVVDVGSAEEGLAMLESRRFDLVLADYLLPGENAAWMLQRARAAGRLRNVGVVIVTAHPGPEGLDDFRVVGKPADVDRLLVALQDAEASARVPEERVSSPQSSTGRPHLELVLYVSGTSAASERARANLDALLAGYDLARVAYSVCDLAADHSRTGDHEGIAFTPCVLKRHPAPREWLLGDLSNPEPLHSMIRGAKIETAR